MTDIAAAPPLSVLLLEDSEFDAELIWEYLQRMGSELDVVRAYGRSDFAEALAARRFDVILCDYSLPGFDGLRALELASEKAPETPFIFVSGVLGEEIAIESFKKGATDYVLKQRLIRLPTAVQRALAEAREKSERLRAERQMELLVGELSHRVKNMLALVISIIRRTARSMDSVEDYERVLLSRMQAIADAHSLVFETNWRETHLDQVLQRTLHPFRKAGERSIVVQGPRVRLEPKAALTLSLVFHELITNAFKHGALRHDTGSVSARWNIEADGTGRRVHLLWEEAGTSGVTEPTRSGFGTMLLKRSVEYDLDGSAHMEFRPTGLLYELRFPVTV